MGGKDLGNLGATVQAFATERKAYGGWPVPKLVLKHLYKAPTDEEEADFDIFQDNLQECAGLQITSLKYQTSTLIS